MSSDLPESLSREHLHARQETRLRRLVQLAARQNPFWRDRLQLHGVRIAEIQSLGDLHKLPFLTKPELVADQAAHPPYGTNLTFPRAQFCRLHQTSGTSGKPLRWLDTPDSWGWFMDCWEQIYRLCEIRDEDVFAFPFSFGPFIGFWAAFEGAQRRGNLALAMGGMSSEARLQMLLELQATVVCCTPTYALRLADVAEQQKLDLVNSPVRMLIVAGEPGGSVPAVRQRIEAAWGARVIDHWGMTDIGSLGIEPAAAPGGLLILETECIAEILEPGGSAAVPAGELGELVITNLGRIGQPVIRYRTGDLVRAGTAPAACNSQLLWLEGGILGRADDMVSIRGNNVFPSSIDALLCEFPEIAEYRTTVITRRSMPHLKIEIEPAFPSDQAPDKLMALLDRLHRAVKDRLNFQAEIIAVPALPRFEHKARRFFRE